MDLIEKNETEFYKKNFTLGEGELLKYLKNKELNFQRQKESLLVDLQFNFLQLKNKYKKFQNENKVSNLSVLFFSFMRTGILTKGDLYRIDLYDQRGLSNIVECGISWNPSCLDEMIKDFRLLMKPYFEMRGELKLYYLDKIVTDAAEKINQSFTILLQEVVLIMVPEYFSEEINNLKIYIGDYLNDGILIYDGGQESGLFSNYTGSSFDKDANNL